MGPACKNVRIFVKTLLKTIANIEGGRQVVKASGSVGANYREYYEHIVCNFCCGKG